MDIRQITPAYSVTEQIVPDDVPAIAAAGFRAVICNRPDTEVPPPVQADALRVAVESAGLAFHVLPLTHQSMTPDNMALQFDHVAKADGPVLAYCASGTRCTVIWALSEAGKTPVDDILSTAQNAGYPLEGLRGTLEAMAKV